MVDSAALPVVGMDYECITDSILQTASCYATMAKPGTTVSVEHHYKCATTHNPVVQMLLTSKVREYRHLRYLSTLFGYHTFLVT